MQSAEIVQCRWLSWLGVSLVGEVTSFFARWPQNTSAKSAKVQVDCSGSEGAIRWTKAQFVAFSLQIKVRSVTAQDTESGAR